VCAAHALENREVGVRKILLATVSVVALGLGGAGLAFAAGTTNSNAGTGAGTTMPSAAGTSQPGYNTGTNTSSAMPSSTTPATTGTSQWGTGGRMGWHSEVMQVQQKLQADNLYSGKIDGRMGPETRQALRSYQQQKGLRVNARLDRETRDSILGNGGTAQGSGMAPGTGTMPQTPPVPATR
jgi:peptidoglycan hydrolase-like protein with peptidoglycan-binding domain